MNTIFCPINTIFYLEYLDALHLADILEEAGSPLACQIRMGISMDLESGHPQIKPDGTVIDDVPTAFAVVGVYLNTRPPVAQVLINRALNDYRDWDTISVEEALERVATNEKETRA